MAITKAQGVYTIAAADAGVVFASGSVVLKGWRWVGGTTAGHAMSITDSAGGVLAASSIGVANDERWSEQTIRSNKGLTVALGSGTLYLYT
jgi:hypothetical protein